MDNTYLIIPVYNEGKYLPRFISVLKPVLEKEPRIKKIVFVDDGSTDSSHKILSRFAESNSQVSVLRHHQNKGKGQAMRTGLHYAEKCHAAAVVFMDADLQHEPRFLPRFLDALKPDCAVLGYRELGKNMPFIRQFGNRMVKKVISLLFNIRCQDILCGFLAFPKSLFSQVKWQANDYGVETEISTVIAKKKIPFTEVKVSTVYYQPYKGVNLWQALLIMLKIPLWYFREAGLIWTASFLLMLVYLPLVFRKALSADTLIPNLDPFPDSLYYALPAMNFVRGKGLVMLSQGLKYAWITPPLYSLFLIIPFFLLRDVAGFYYLNLFLALLDIYFFVKIIFQLSPTRSSMKFLFSMLFGFLLVTNFYFYNLPAYLLAENLTLFLTLFAISRLTDKTKFVSISSVLTPFFLLLIKFANFGLSLGLGLGLTAKALWPIKKRNWIAFFLYSAMGMAILGGYLWFSKILIGHKNLASGTSFIMSSFLPNLIFYLRSLLGQPSQFLWFRNLLWHPLFGWLFLLSLVLNIRILLTDNKSRLVLGVILAQIAFMSFFYVADLRFIFAVIPLWLALTAASLQRMTLKWPTRMLAMSALVFLGVYVFLPGIYTDQMNLTTWRKQVVLNLKYREVPWNYLAVKEFDSYFGDRKVYLGTFLPLPYLELIQKGRYTPIPLTERHDFVHEPGAWMEQKKIKDLNNYYQKLLTNRKEVYVSNAYVNNLHEWVGEYEIMRERYDFQLVHRGCLDTCNIYRLRLLTENE